LRGSINEDFLATAISKAALDCNFDKDGESGNFRVGLPIQMEFAIEECHGKISVHFGRSVTSQREVRKVKMKSEEG
jgi:hypothetical protein